MKDRRLLVGGMKAEKILILSELLKGYLKHGLVVTKVYQANEFNPIRVFREFVKNVSDARHEGDKDPSMAPIGTTSNFLGNAGFGGFLMRTELHQETKYVDNRGRP